MLNSVNFGDFVDIVGRSCGSASQARLPLFKWPSVSVRFLDGVFMAGVCHVRIMSQSQSSQQWEAEHAHGTYTFLHTCRSVYHLFCHGLVSVIDWDRVFVYVYFFRASGEAIFSTQRYFFNVFYVDFCSRLRRGDFLYTTMLFQCVF